jgi:choline dehydrogenase-like flavoprotein
VKHIECDTLVIGSGPGGATTAAMLAGANRDVVLVEEGRHLHIDSSADHSLAQMSEKWRSSGLTAALGKPKVTYIEGRCVGGASESNAGLFHAPLDPVTDAWARDFEIADFDAASLGDHVDKVVDEIGVSARPNGFSPASQRMAAGADALGWGWAEIQRFWAYSQGEDGEFVGHRRSMSETLIPRGLAAGVRLMSQTRIDRLERVGRRVTAGIGLTGLGGPDVEPVRIDCKRVVVCAGAIQTPRLLRNSGWTHVGDGLTLNPMVRIVARFPEPVNVPAFGVPVVQIEAFKPAMTLGCSYSAPPHLGMWLEGSPREVRRQLEDWEHLAVFYVKVCGQGAGSVRTMPFFGDALVRYKAHPDDFTQIGIGLRRLAQALFAAGATEVHSPLPGAAPLTHTSQAGQMERILTPRNASLSAIHLHSTVRMGENRNRCGADSHGRLFGADNVYVNDSSLLPSSPGVNPQATILAIARRNVCRWLDE